MKNTGKEIFLIVVLIIPIIQLIIIWNKLPDIIPTHYGISGEADKYNSKDILLWFVPVCLLGTYLLLLAVPFIDPKKRISLASTSYYSIRLIVLAFLSAVFVIYQLTLQSGTDFSNSISFILLLFVIVLGNFMPTLKPNYFVGIRTPWTLESEVVWTKTHRFSGRLWMVGGLLGLVIYLLWPSPLSPILAAIIILLLAFISVVHSYLVYKKESQ